MSVIEVPQTTPATRTATPKEVLHRAADLLEEFGWCQRVAAITEDGSSIGCGEFEFDRRRRIAYCHNGAILQAALDLGLTSTDHRIYPLATFEAYMWNDVPGRTTAEVVAKLRESAEAAA